MRRPSGRLRKGAVLLVLMGLGASALADPAGAPAPDLITSGLSELHQGLYARAEEAFGAAAREAPDDAEPLLFVAFARWWRILLEDRGKARGGDRFDEAIDATLETGERRLRAAPDDARAMASVGVAHILRSHVEAMRRNYFHAAQEARRGKRLLEASLDHDPGLTDALFALGALNYYADKVPALIKGLRALLFLPGGDADRGLEQLRTVAGSPAHFRTDARLLLALICGSREEGCFTAAEAHLRGALEDNPGSPLILASVGEIQMRLGEYDEASRTFDEAMHAATGDDPERALQRRALRIALAEALVAGWRLERAAAILREASLDAGPVPPGARKAQARAALELAIKRGEAPLASWDADAQAATPAAVSSAAAGSPPGDPAETEILAQALQAEEEGRRSEALAFLRQAVEAHPRQALARFLRGRVLVLAGRYAEGDADLAAAEDLAPHPPPWMQGWIELYRGMADAGRGNARAARGHFHRASAVRHFASADRGVRELHAGDPENPRCTP